MGSLFSLLVDKFYRINGTNKKVLLIMVGPAAAAGKTTILYKLKDVKKEIIPTVGCDVENVEHANFSFTIWTYRMYDILVQPAWCSLLNSTNTKGVIFVVDSSDRDHEIFDQARNELHQLIGLLDNYQKYVSLLILANKQDESHAMSIEELIEKLQMNNITDRRWHVQPCSGISGAGLNDGLDWLSNQIEMKEDVV